MTLALGIDISIVFVLIFLSLRGFFRGLTGELFSLGGVIGGAFLAWHLGPALSSWYLEKWAGNPSIVLVISMALLFILVVVIATLACRMVQIFLRWSALSFIDRILGGMAGALKGVFLVLFLYAVLMAFSSFISPQWFKESIAMKLASQAWPHVNTFLYSAEGDNLSHEST